MLNTVSLADGYKSEGTGYTRAALCLSALKPETRQDHAFVFKEVPESWTAEMVD